MDTSFYTEEELGAVGFKHYGRAVLVSRRASIYHPEEIELGDNVRIDDFCVLSGAIKIGNNVHISAGVYMYGKYGIEIGDYSGCSAGCKIYSETDDFSGEYMIGAVLPKELTNVIHGRVVMKKYSQLGANTVVMPGVTIEEGAVTGAMTFVKCSLEPWTINVGVPARKLKNRSRSMLGMIAS